MAQRFTYLFAFVLVMLVSSVSHAQELTASGPSQVQQGQRFQVNWTLNANGSGFIAPEITDFQVLGGPNQSTSMQYVNGSMSQSITYSYILLASRDGEFKIEPAKIKAGGKVIESNSLKVKVLQANSVPEATPQKTQASAPQGSSSDLFARVEVSKTNCYLGERITADLKIYSRVTMVNFDDWKMPSFEGFWTKETTSNQQIQLQNEVIDGIMYQTGLIKQMVLYPQKSGDIVIDPLELSVIIRERTSGRGRSVFDQFFGGYEDSKRPIKSNAVTINVKPFPSGKPSDFSGLTGKLNMKATLDKSETKANEAVNLKITVSGEGNLYQLQPLDLDFPPDVEVYDPKTSDNIKLNSSGISGSRTFEYVLIPRYAGDFKIGPFAFSYFDPAAKEFKTINQDAFDLIVTKGDGETTASSPAINFANKEDIKMLGSDIRYIKQGQYPILNGTHFFYRSVPFYAAIGLPLILFVLLIGYAEYQKAQGKDVVKLKSKRATGLAKKRLTKAKKLWDDNQTASFYEEVFKALTEYVGSKFAIPVSELSKDRIRSTFAEKTIPDDVANTFIGVLDKTEFARFAPGADKEMGSVYDEALDAIVKVENHA